MITANSIITSSSIVDSNGWYTLYSSYNKPSFTSGSAGSITIISHITYLASDNTAAGYALLITSCNDLSSNTYNAYCIRSRCKTGSTEAEIVLHKMYSYKLSTIESGTPYVMIQNSSETVFLVKYKEDYTFWDSTTGYKSVSKVSIYTTLLYRRAG